MSDYSGPSVFITGASGFIGAAVLDQLVERGVGPITCLIRNPADWVSPRSGHPSIRVASGDLTSPDSYRDALNDAGIVIHLAAATGSAPPDELRRVNVLATERLLHAAGEASVRNFIFMSSIAAAGSDIGDYPYAISKRDAETAVANSPLAATILRPTIVLGNGGGNWSMLRKLACLPVIPLFGSGRARIQPVDVTDVARAVAMIVSGYAPGRPIVEIGGPERLTFAEFMLRIRVACGVRGSAALPVPIAPARAVLRLAKGLLGDSFPLSPGQLSPFVNDGTAASSPLGDTLREGMKPLDDLLRGLCDVG